MRNIENDDIFKDLAKQTRAVRVWMTISKITNKKKRKQEVFLRCQTPTSTVWLKVEEYMVKNGGCRIESEELEGLRFRVKNGGCKFEMEDRRVILQNWFFSVPHTFLPEGFVLEF